LRLRLQIGTRDLAEESRDWNFPGGNLLTAVNVVAVDMSALR
jgi:hypothetical protein